MKNLNPLYENFYTSKISKSLINSGKKNYILNRTRIKRYTNDKLEDYRKKKDDSDNED